MRYGIGRWMVAIGAFAGLSWGAVDHAQAQVFVRTRVFVPGPVIPLPPRPPVFVPGPVVVAPPFVPVPPPVPYVYGPPLGPGGISIRAPFTSIDIRPGRVQVATPGYVGDIATPEFRFQQDDSIVVPPDAVEGEPTDGVAPTTPETPESRDIAPPADSNEAQPDGATSILKNRGRDIVTRKASTPAKHIRLTNTSKTQSVSLKVNTFPFTLKPGESQYFSIDSQWKLALDSFQKNPAKPTLALEPGDYEFSHSAEEGWKVVRKSEERPAPAAADTESLPPPIPAPAPVGEPTLADPPAAADEPTSPVSTGAREF